MKRPSLAERAKTDPELARFLKKTEKKAAKRAEQRAAFIGPPRPGNLPKTRDLSPEAIDAINNIFLPKQK